MNDKGNWGILLIGIGVILFALSHTYETVMIWQEMNFEQEMYEEQMNKLDRLGY